MAPQGMGSALRARPDLPGRTIEASRGHGTDAACHGRQIGLSSTIHPRAIADSGTGIQQWAAGIASRRNQIGAGLGKTL